MTALVVSQGHSVGGKVLTRVAPWLYRRLAPGIHPSSMSSLTEGGHREVEVLLPDLG